MVSNILGGSEAQRSHFIHHRSSGAFFLVCCQFLPFNFDSRFLSSDSKSSPILANLLECIHSDEFDLQQEAVRALEHACLDASALHLLSSPSQLASTLAPLARELERLLRVPSSDVPLCVARIVSAITDAHSKQCAVSGYVRYVFESGWSLMDILLTILCVHLSLFLSGKYDLVHTWVDAGITEALDDIQVTDS